MGEAAEHLHPVPGESGKLFEPVELKEAPSPPPMPSASSTQSSMGPHWRVDLKWVFGIPFTALLMFTLVFVSLYQMTSRDNAVETLTAMNQPVLAQQEFQAKLAAAAPVLAAFVQSPGFAGAVYDEPASYDAAIATIPAPDSAEMVEAVPQDADQQATTELAAEQQNGVRGVMALYSIPLKILNNNTHSIFSGIMMVLIVLLVLTGVPFILLSRRAGKFVSPGISLALASWLPLLILVGAQSGMASWVDARQAETEAADGKMLGDVVRPFSDNMFGSALSVYRFVVFVSVGLFLAAAVTYAYIRVRERQRNLQEAPAESPAVDRVIVAP
jgi:hypothetical protein